MGDTSANQARTHMRVPLNLIELCPWTVRTRTPDALYPEADAAGWSKFLTYAVMPGLRNSNRRARLRTCSAIESSFQGLSSDDLWRKSCRDANESPPLQ